MGTGVLVYFPTNLGDAILCLPSLDRVKHAYPNSKITGLVSPKTAHLFSRNNFLNEIKEFDKKWPVSKKLRFSLANRGKYHTVIDFKNSLLPIILNAKKRTPFIRNYSKNILAKDIYLDLVKNLTTNNASLKSDFTVTTEEKNKFQEIAPNSLFITCASRSHFKSYEYNCLYKTVKELSFAYSVVILGEKCDRKYYRDILNINGVVDLVGKTSMPEVFYLIKNYAKLLFCVDSSILHIASYLNVATVVIFGPTNSQKYGPSSQNSILLKGTNTDKGVVIDSKQTIEAIRNLWTHLKKY
ncbi:MAG: glycosyltransferase family 9 protein [Candidatus Omnitrophica bacterium]|nr:glycosyltransferase family 9 protein [Candidatus Omnitrophota bacterium]